MVRLALIAAGFIALSSGVFLFAFYEFEQALYLLRWAALLTIAPLLLVACIFMLAILEAATERLTARDLNDSGSIGGMNIRLIPVHARAPTLDWLDPRDLRFFVEQIGVNGDPSQDEWRGKRLPSGKACDNDYHALLCEAVAKTGHMVEPGPRRKRRLIDFEVDDVLADLGLAEGAE